MTTSQAVTLEYNVTELIEEAYERAGIDVQMLNAHHMRSARRSMNLIFSSWANKGIRLWALDQQTQTVTDGDPTYTLPAGTVDVLDAVLTRDSVDTPMHRISRTDYHVIPDKTQEGRPDRFWVDRQIGTQTMYVWPTPENSTDVIDYWRLRRLYDVTAATETADVPQRAWEALTCDLAERLLLKRPDDQISQVRLSELKSARRESFYDMRTEDRDRAPSQVYPEQRRI
mgnify:CR=1 FL=1